MNSCCLKCTWSQNRGLQDDIYLLQICSIYSVRDFCFVHRFSMNVCQSFSLYVSMILRCIEMIFARPYTFCILLKRFKSLAHIVPQCEPTVAIILTQAIVVCRVLPSLSHCQALLADIYPESQSPIVTVISYHQCIATYSI